MSEHTILGRWQLVRSQARSRLDDRGVIGQSGRMAILGAVLLILGLVLSSQLLTWIGAILLVVGLLLNLLPIGGKTRRVF